MRYARRSWLGAVLVGCTFFALPSFVQGYAAESPMCGNYYSAQICWVGFGYHGIKQVTEFQHARRSESCAKGRTAAGNIRTGSGCNYNTDSRISKWSDPSPYSAGYGYWAGSGSPINVTVREDGLWNNNMGPFLTRSNWPCACVRG